MYLSRPDIYYWFIFSTGQYKICTFSDKMTEYAGLVHIVWGQYALTNAWLGHNITGHSGDNTTHLAIIQTIMQSMWYVTYMILCFIYNLIYLNHSRDICLRDHFLIHRDLQFTTSVEYVWQIVRVMKFRRKASLGTDNSIIINCMWYSRPSVIKCLVDTYSIHYSKMLSKVTLHYA